MEYTPIRSTAADYNPSAFVLPDIVADEERRTSLLQVLDDPSSESGLREAIAFDLAAALIDALVKDRQSSTAYGLIRTLSRETAALLLEIVTETDFLTGSNNPNGVSAGIVLAAAALMSAAGQHDESINLLTELLLSDTDSLDYSHALFVAKRKQRGLSDDLSNHFCPVPFERFDVSMGGLVGLCCGMFLRKYAGNVNERSGEQIWNGPEARDIRASIHDGSYRHCDKLRCGKFETGLIDLAKSDEQILDETRPFAGSPNEGRSMDREMLDVARSRRTELAAGPRMVNLAFDETCNLSCPSCRKEIIAAKPAERDQMLRMAEEKIMPVLRDTRLLVVTGSGDPFASKTFRHIMRSIDPEKHPELELKIMTNGVLFTPAEWNRIARLRGHIRSVTISIDAAEPETYAIVRRGGNWDRLQANLRFLGSLRQEGAFRELRLAFVVQAENWRQIPAFIAMGREVGASVVHFAPIENWGTFEPEIYETKAVHFPTHPDHLAFKALMASNVVQDSFAEFGVLEAFKAQAD